MKSLNQELAGFFQVKKFYLFSDNLNKVRGYNKRRGGFQVDGILYSNLPYILSSRVKYIEIP